MLAELEGEKTEAAREQREAALRAAQSFLVVVGRAGVPWGAIY